ncbi:MAG TPA: DJ-1/PfpI family protein [Bryobacteraceae bacterium]|nr:DJ-1/PfpI family protein [Bryobacteraceae bacterium]
MKTQIGMLLYPRLTQLDLTGPFEVFHRLSETEVHLIWKTIDPVRSDSGMSILPTTTLADCPKLDVLCVPGGPGQIELMDDKEVLEWLKQRAAEVQWITSVCTGSLLLGAAGLLQGYRAACHWMSRDQLALLGAVPSPERVVLDRNRITGGGVTAGIDFALQLAELLRDETEARSIGLQLEYDPAPPFGPGSPDQCELNLIVGLQRRAKSLLAARRAATERARDRLNSTLS